jgi:hypothetical protein
MKIIGNVGTQKLISQNMGEIVLGDMMVDDHDARTWCCLFSIQPNLAGLVVPVSIDIRMRYGAAGFMIDSGWITALNGVNPSVLQKNLTIPVNASRVTVSARVRCINPDDTFPIGAYITANSAARDFQSITIFEQAVLAGLGSTYSVSLNPFAKRVSLYQDAPFDGYLSLQSNLAAVIEVRVVPGNNIEKLPIGSSETLYVRNDTPAAVTISLVYELEF